MLLIYGFYARYRVRRKAHANNEKLKSAWNAHKNESFYAYENVKRLYNIEHNLSFVQNLYKKLKTNKGIKNDFVIH